ncbi:hypothetical protein [Methylobacterium radiodurans]|uniref:hypothetical protein n=1 Tax=Methylobacterium radiodurans TaxID=2202828 RepID=UPI0013A57B46|nr:hypothetical protein [Methylobacterium radiodurans]
MSSADSRAPVQGKHARPRIGIIIAAVIRPFTAGSSSIRIVKRDLSIRTEHR